MSCEREHGSLCQGPWPKPAPSDVFNIMEPVETGKPFFIPANSSKANGIPPLVKFLFPGTTTYLHKTVNYLDLEQAPTQVLSFFLEKPNDTEHPEA